MLNSRLQLLRIENNLLDHEPVLSKTVDDALNQVISERNNIKTLIGLGLQPTKSMLFTDLLASGKHWPQGG